MRSEAESPRADSAGRWGVFDPAAHAERLARETPLGMTLSLFAELTPQRTAVQSVFGSLTFGELERQANQLVRLLRQAGLEHGDGFAVLLRNRPEFAVALAACMRSGLRMTPINFHLTADEAVYIVEDSEAKALVADATCNEAAKRAALAPGLRLRLSVGGEIPGCDDFAAAVARVSGERIEEPVFSYAMLYTSGTTGRPKGVFRPTREALPPGFADTIHDFRPHEDCHLLTGPAYHAAPLMSLARAVVSGVATVMMDKWDAEETLRLIAEHRVSHCHMVPTMFHRLLRLPEAVRERYDVSSMRVLMHGAAPCPVPDKHAMIEWFGPVLWEYYAATEGGNGFLVGSEEWLGKPGTVGKPAPEFENKILDESGQELPPGEVGMVYMKAPAQGRFSYFKAPEKTASAYRGDFFTLGDHGYIDEDGYLFLTGRSAELIISGGVNIYPAEVDQRLLEHVAVADVCTIGVPNEEWGEEVKAVVELASGYAPSAELAAELIAFARAGLATFKCPRSVDFVAELPRLPSGKIQRARVRAAHGAGSG